MDQSLLRPSFQIGQLLRSVRSPPPVTLRDDPGPEIRMGAAIAAAFFIGFLGWAAVARMDAAAFAVGQVTVAGHRQSVQHREGGVVQRLLVQEGQQVRKGQVLVELAGGDVQARARALSAQVWGLKALRARLMAEQLGLARIAWPAEFAAATGDDRVDADQAMQVQQEQFAARASLLATQKQVLRQRGVQLGEQAEGYRRQTEASVQQEASIAQELEGLRTLQAKGFAPLNRIRELERRQAEIRGQRGQYAATVAQSREQIGETQLQVLEADRTQREKVAAELKDTEFALNDLMPKLSAAQEELARIQLRAPTDGTVVGLSVFTVGGIVEPGQKLMDVVPTQAKMIISARVSPNDADDLEPGQTTQVKFTGLHERNLPTLTGKLLRLSADAFNDERTGASYFTADVEVPQDQVALIQKTRGGDFALRSGMPVQVLIPLRKRTALQYAFEPLAGAMWRAFREH